MGLLSSWFRKSQPEDYEQALASLALDIQKRQTRLSEIRLRERRSTLLFSIYALSLWVAYVSLWYTDLVPTMSSRPRYSRFERVLEAAPVFAGPIVILFIRRIVQIWYTRIGDTEEKHLVTLRKQQREKIEEIKKKTNYYTTRTLIERYDDGTGPETPLRKRTPAQVVSGAPATPQRASQPLPPRLVTPHTPAQISANLQQHLSPSPQRPLPPPRKQWYDKLADAILGDDDASVSAAASRYALICQRCFAHNGLVKDSMWEDAQYVCPKCGHFNPSARSMRQPRSAIDRSSMSPPTNALALSLGQHDPHRLGPTPEGTGSRSERSRSRSRPDDGAGDESRDEHKSHMEVDS